MDFEQIVAKVTENKTLLIKIGAAVVGAIVGAVVVNAVLNYDGSMIPAVDNIWEENEVTPE
jgi:hypothetical protein